MVQDGARAKMEISISHRAHMFVVSCHGGKAFMVYYLYRWFSYLDWGLQPHQLSNTDSQ